MSLNLFDFANISQAVLNATVVEREAMQEFDDVAVDQICGAAGNSQDSDGGAQVALIDNDATFAAMLTYIQGAINLNIANLAPTNATSMLDPEVVARFSSVIDEFGTPTGSWVELYKLARDAELVLSNLGYGTDTALQYVKLALLKQKSYTDLLFWTDGNDNTTNRNPVIEALIDRTDTETMREIIDIAKDREATISSVVSIGGVTYVYRCGDHASNIIVFDVARKLIGKKKK